MTRVEVTYHDGVDTTSTARFSFGKQEDAETIEGRLILCPDSDDPLVLRIPIDGRLEIKAV